MQTEDVAVEMGGVSYHGYEHAHPIPNSQPYHQQFVPPHPQSPIQGQVHHMHSTDPHASWNYLFAQFNQI